MTDTATLDELSEVHRVELTGYCYRMLGSITEAEDAVQETMLRAWKSADSFEGRSSLRSWLYRIATNVCLTMTEGRAKRAMPVDLGPSSRADAPLTPKRPEIPWMEPAPDSRVIPLTADPADVVQLRQSIHLAFLVALQNLPARQRAALVLCEVLHWRAEEVAEFLETSVASVNSALQRARATLAGATHAPSPGKDAQLVAQRYADSFQRYDMDEVAAMLREDVVMSMPPYELWLQGPDQVKAWCLGTGIGCKGSRMVPTYANGCPAFGQYRLGADGYEAWSLMVLGIENGVVTSITSFLDTPQLFPYFDLPLTLAFDAP